ncbi:MAG TPA: CopG family antitoxin [Anaerolineae bacterium]|nr:CopG family antitoxin [Anaerolineae bacterium]
MARNKQKSLPKFRSAQKLIEFFDTHDMGDYWDAMPEAHFEIDITKQKHLISLDQELAEQVSAIARSKRISSKTLIKRWLREKVSQQTHPRSSSNHLVRSKNKTMR